MEFWSWCTKLQKFKWYITPKNMQTQYKKKASCTKIPTQELWKKNKIVDMYGRLYQFIYAMTVHWLIGWKGLIRRVCLVLLIPKIRQFHLQVLMMSSLFLARFNVCAFNDIKSSIIVCLVPFRCRLYLMTWSRSSRE